MSSKLARASRNNMPSMQALRCFEAASRMESFKAAANELHITPSAISHRIADLEAMLGVALFERGGRSVKLTDRKSTRLNSSHG